MGPGLSSKSIAEQRSLIFKIVESLKVSNRMNRDNATGPPKVLNKSLSLGLLFKPGHFKYDSLCSVTFVSEYC